MASWGSKHNFSIIILLAVLFASCSGNEEIPGDIMTKEEMTHVMIGIHILEGKVGRLGIQADSAKLVYNHLEKEIFAKSGIDSAYFYKSFEYYNTHPDSFSTIYHAVVDSLLEMESKEKLSREAEIEALRKSDSVNHVPDSLRYNPDNDRPKRMNINTRKSVPQPALDIASKPIKNNMDAKQPK